MATDSYLGCRAQINTKSKFKYDGTIAAINATDQTITLGNVHIVQAPGGKAFDAAKLYASVTFKGTDVEDLQVFDPSVATDDDHDDDRESGINDRAPKLQLEDPAILNLVERNQRHGQRSDDWLDPQFPYGPSSSNNNPPTANAIATQTAQFELERSKNAAATALSSSASLPPPLSMTYNPAVSFFDNLSTMKQRGELSVGGTDDYRRERSLNVETFGEATTASHSSTSSSSFYRGRGGRGRGHHHRASRGGGRYQHHYQHHGRSAYREPATDPADP